MKSEKPRQREYDTTNRDKNDADSAIPDKYYRLWGEPMQAVGCAKKGDTTIDRPGFGS